MKQVLVISGKGGTGKTSIVAGFASLAEGAVFADCDVDAPDLHIILKPEIEEETGFQALKVAVKDPEKCTGCGRCLETCRFKAVTEEYEIKEHRCEGCGACAFICPESAISMKPREAGRIYSSRSRLGRFIHAKLNIGEEASGKLVSEVKKKALAVAEKEGKRMVLIDGSPGIGCPVIASLAGVDLAIIVTEPTVSGVHDLERICEVTKHFGIKAVVCLNKYDINPEKADEVEGFCRERDIKILGRIPYDECVTSAMVRLETVVEHGCEIAADLKRVWERAMEEI